MKLYITFLIFLFSVTVSAHSASPIESLLSFNSSADGLSSKDSRKAKVVTAEQIWNYIFSPENNGMDFHALWTEDGVTTLHYFQHHDELLEFKFNLKNRLKLGGTQVLKLVGISKCQSRKYNVRLEITQESAKSVLVTLHAYQMYFHQFDLCHFGNLEKAIPIIAAQVRMNFKVPVKLAEDDSELP